jgi:hypothetical protein
MSTTPNSDTIQSALAQLAAAREAMERAIGVKLVDTRSTFIGWTADANVMLALLDSGWTVDITAGMSVRRDDDRTHARVMFHGLDAAKIEIIAACPVVMLRDALVKAGAGLNSAAAWNGETVRAIAISKVAR